MSQFNTQNRKRSRRPMLVGGVVGIVAIGIIWLIVRSLSARIITSVPTVTGDQVSHAFLSKRALMSRVTELETTIASYDAQLSNLALLEHENAALKAELGRGIEPKGKLAHVLTEPNRSFYDTLIIDGGSDSGIHEGQIAYAFDSVALGTISAVTPTTATVLLYSAPERETPGTSVGTDVTVTLIGRGGGEYEVRMPRDVRFEVGGMIAQQSIHVANLARIEKIVTDPRDPFQRLLAKAPVNLQALKWVIVR